MSQLNLIKGDRQEFEQLIKGQAGFLLRRRLFNMLEKSAKKGTPGEFEAKATKTIERSAKISQFMRVLSLLSLITLIVLAIRGGFKDYLAQPQKNAQQLNERIAMVKLLPANVIANNELENADVSQFNAEVSRTMRDLKKNQPTTYQVVKDIYQAQGAQWKDVLYSGKYTKITASKRAQVEPDYRAGAAEYDEMRYTAAQTQDASKGAAIMGTTFTSNVVSLLKRNNADQGPVVSHIMDSAYVAQATDDRLLVAIGDGLGGHTGDKAQDKAIARASYFASKNAVRMMSAYKNADDLKQAIPQIVKQIEQEVKIKLGDTYREGTSLTAAVAFKDEASGTMRVIGFSIGDSQMLSYSPSAKIALNLLPAKQTVSKMGKGPAYFPFNYNADAEVEVMDKTIPVDSVLLPMTDGISDEFTAKVTRTEIDENSHYENTSVDTQDIKPILDNAANTGASAQHFAQAIVDEAMRRAQEKVGGLLDKFTVAETVIEGKQDEKKTLMNAKKKLKKGIKNIGAKKEDGKLTDEQYQEKLAEFRAKLDANKASRDGVQRQIEIAQQHQTITTGDDVGIVAARFGQ